MSREFGFDRGKPVDRWYIERFLAQHRADVRGAVLEVAESTYTQWYGDGDVTSSDVLHHAGNEESTVVGDLTTGAGLPSGPTTASSARRRCPSSTTSTRRSAGIARVLKPGGVVLATVPGMSQVSREDKRDWGDWWRFTSQGDANGSSARPTTTSRSRRTATCSRPRRSSTRTRPRSSTEQELAHRDPEYELLITVRATSRTP